VKCPVYTIYFTESLSGWVRKVIRLLLKNKRPANEWHYMNCGQGTGRSVQEDSVCFTSGYL